jgi:hypothetical protein
VPGGTADWSFEGGTNYIDQDGSVDIVIDAATLEVDAVAASKTYGEDDPAFTYALDGFVNGEDATSASVTGDADCSRASGENVGTYQITCEPGNLAAPNYVFQTGDSADFDIDPRPIEVTADAKSKIFGNPDPPLTYQLTDGSLVGSDAISGALTRVAGELVGSYAILQGTLTAGTNYDITYVGADLTIGAWDANGKGFYQPVGVPNSVFVAAPGVMPPATSSTVWNSAKGGSTVPLKFQVFAGGVEKTNTSDINYFTATKLSNCSAGSSEEPVEFVTTGQTVLRYDGGQFIQNWKTPSSNKEECYRASVKFLDGSSLSAFFKLKK